MLRASEICERAGYPTSSLVCEGFLSQAAATSVGLGMPNMPVATIVGHPGAQASEEIAKLGVERGVSQLRYYYFDADDDFELDTDVLGTNYLGLRSLTQYAEGAAGHA